MGSERQSAAPLPDEPTEPGVARPVSAQAPLRMTQARAPLTQAISAIDAHGRAQRVAIPAERPLTLYVDKREIVTLMTLGAQPELLVLGYLLNQRLVQKVDELVAISVDWEVNAAAVQTRAGLPHIEARTARRVVTTGCGQGSVFGDLMDHVHELALPALQISQAELYALVAAVRTQESTYKSAGSVHACALFTLQDGAVQLRQFVEDVGRHNAIDTLAGWLALQPPALQAAPRIFYTTGRLTSEMVIKSAQMGVPVVVSRSGITQMGHAVAQQLGLCTIGRALNRHFLCYSAPERLRLQPELASPEPDKSVSSASP